MKYVRQIIIGLFILIIFSCCDSPKSIVEPEDIMIVDVPKTIKLGESIQLYAKVLPEDVSNKTVIWESSTEYATITSNGVLSLSEKALVGSSFRIYAFTYDRKLSDYADIKITEGNGLQIIYNDSVLDDELIISEDVKTLRFSVEYNNKTISNVEWSSSNPNVASISDGVVSILNPGKTVITAVYEGEKTEVSIIASGYILDKDSVTFYEGESAILNVTAFGLSSLEDIEIKIDNKDAVTLSGENGKFVISSNIPGIYTVYVANIGITITVMSRNMSIVADSIANLDYVNPETELKLYVKNDFSGNMIDGVIFSSSNSEIASVSRDGILYAHKPGSFTIIAELPDGEIVTKFIEVSGLAISDNHLALFRKEQGMIRVEMFGDASLTLPTIDDLSVSFDEESSLISIQPNENAFGSYEILIYDSLSGENDVSILIDVPVFSLSMPETMTYNISDGDVYLDTKIVEETSFDTRLPEISYSCNPDDLFYVDSKGKLCLVDNPNPDIYETCKKDILVTAYAGGTSSSCLVTVILLGEKSVNVSGYIGSLTDPQILNPGETLKLYADTIFPEYQLAWRSLDESIVTVTSDGLISAVSTGEGKVALYYTDYDFRDVLTIDVVVRGYEISDLSFPAVILEKGTISLKTFGQATIPDISSWIIPDHVTINEKQVLDGCVIYEISADKAGEYTVLIDDNHSFSFEVLGREIEIRYERQTVGSFHINDVNGPYVLDMSQYMDESDTIAIVRINDRIRYDVNKPEDSIFDVKEKKIYMESEGINGTIISVTKVKALLYDYVPADIEKFDYADVGEPLGYYEDIGAAVLFASENALDTVLVRMTGNQDSHFNSIYPALSLNEVDNLTIDFAGYDYTGDIRMRTIANNLFIINSQYGEEQSSYNGTLTVYLNTTLCNAQIRGIDFPDSSIIYDPYSDADGPALNIVDCTFSGSAGSAFIQTKGGNIQLVDSDFLDANNAVVESEGSSRIQKNRIEIHGGEFSGIKTNRLFTFSGEPAELYIYGVYSHDNETSLGDLFSENMVVYSGVFCSAGNNGLYRDIEYHGGSVPSLSLSGKKRISVDLPQLCSPLSIEVHYRGTSAAPETIQINERRCNFDDYLIDEITFYIDNNIPAVDYIVVSDMKNKEPLTVFLD